MPCPWTSVAVPLYWGHLLEAPQIAPLPGCAVGAVWVFAEDSCLRHQYQSEEGLSPAQKANVKMGLSCKAAQLSL